MSLLDVKQMTPARNAGKNRVVPKFTIRLLNQHHLHYFCIEFVFPVVVVVVGCCFLTLDGKFDVINK